MKTFKPIQKKSHILTKYIKGKRCTAICTGEIVINKYATSGKIKTWATYITKNN